jgi:hypothetical protein
METNLFYNLPVELINLIYKKYHTTYVLQELLTRPGIFKNWFEDYKCWSCFFIEQLSVMRFIAVHGWEIYKEQSIVSQESLRYCYFP